MFLQLKVPSLNVSRCSDDEESPGLKKAQLVQSELCCQVAEQGYLDCQVLEIL